MFDWLSNIISGIGDAMGQAIKQFGSEVSNSIFDAMLRWLYETVFGAIADFFSLMGNMGADIFELDWVKSTVRLFTLLGWSLFAVGVIVAVFDIAIEYQSGNAAIKKAALNVLKGFFACSLFGTVPVELYTFCISLQNRFSHALAGLNSGTEALDIASQSASVLQGSFQVQQDLSVSFLNLLCLIAFGYCVIKIFFQNISRGGILLVQVAVGSLYMFSVPRGYSDGFTQWCRQVIAICLTAFLQTTLLFLGLLTFPHHMLLGLGIMLAANETPRIAAQFGLDSSVRINMTGITHFATSAIAAGRRPA